MIPILTMEMLVSLLLVRTHECVHNSFFPVHCYRTMCIWLVGEGNGGCDDSRLSNWSVIIVTEYIQ